MANPWERFQQGNQAAGPWVRFATPAAGSKPGTGFAPQGVQAQQHYIPGSEADPAYVAQKASAQAAADQAARVAAERQILAIQQSTPLAAANLAKAQSEAIVAKQKADEAKAEDAISTMTPNSNVHGDAYLRQFVPPAMWNVVKAYARGDLGSRSGGLSTSMLPIIQHAMNYDPSTSGTNFPARVKMQQDLASGDPKSAGGSLQAFERMLLHGAEVLDAGQKLNNFHSGIGSGLLNYGRATLEGWNQNPDLAHFNEMVRNYAPESQKAIAGVAGGEGERQGRASSFSGSISPEALVAGLQADAKQAYDAMQATNDRYKRIMGHDILDAMSPDAKAAYDKIMAGGYDPKTGNPLIPAAGWRPISGGGNDQQNGGPQGPLPGATPASGATKAQTMDPKTQSIIAGMIKQGMNADQINAVLGPAGMGSVQQSDIDKARQTLKNGGMIAPQYEVPTTLKDRIINSPLGVGVGSAADAGLAGFSDEIGAGIGALTGQGKYSDLLNNLNAGKEAAFAADPRAHLLGTIAGTATGAMGMEAGLGNVASRLGEYGLERGLGTGGSRLAFNAGRVLSSPVAADALYGGLYGAGEGNDNRTASAVLGAGFGAGGGIFGRSFARGAANATRGVTNEAVRYLANSDIPLTVGQALGQSGRFGNAVRSIENGLSGLPIVGDMVKARQREGLQAFNQTAFDQGLAPINATVGQTGADGVAAARQAVGAAYSDTLDPLSFQVDPQFGADYTNTSLRASDLPRTMARNANDTLRLRIQDNIGADGTMAGNDFQQSLRGLRQDAASFRNEPYGADFGGVAQQGQDALRGLVDRQAPGSLQAFDAANAANRNVSVLKDAVNRARNGTRTGETDLFAPSQLSDAAAANARRFGGTEGTPDQPFYQLTRAGQQVLPSTIPDSGTGFRLATVALPGLFSGGGAGVGALTGDAKTGAKTGLVLGGLAALGGSRAAQRTMVSALLDRPDWAGTLADYIARSAPRSGMMFAGLGSAFNPALSQ
jgi:hypothetical protein